MEEFDTQENNAPPLPPPPMPTTFRKFIATYISKPIISYPEVVPSSPPIHTNNYHIPSHPDRDSVALCSKTYSFYQSKWKFNNLLPEMISTVIILQWILYH